MMFAVLRRLSFVAVVAGCCGVVLGASAKVPRLRREVSDVRRADALAAARERGLTEAAGRRAGPSGPVAEGATSRAGPATDGIGWLKANQNASRSWGSTYEFVDTCTVIETLTEVDPGCTELAAGAVWLAGQSAANYEYLARQIIVLAGVPGYEGLVADLTDDLLAARNPAEPDPALPNWPEGGWGIAESYETDCLTTALAMKALDAVGLNGGFVVNDEPLAAGATNIHEWDIPDDATKVRLYVTVSGSTVRLRMAEGSPPMSGPYFELPPGSWLIVFPDSGLPFTPGHNYITVQSTGSAATYTMTASYETPTFNTLTLAEPLAYLREAQNVDGGWGLQRGSDTELYTTMHVLLTLEGWLHYDFETEYADGITYLKSQQLGDGSFGYDGTPIAYVTALGALNLARSETYPFSTETEDAIAALLIMQDVDGSWDQEPYDTALAVLALWDHNQNPTADAGSDQNVTDADEDCLEDVTLDGTGSSDVDGTIDSYVWTEDDVEIATGPSPVVTLPVRTHTLELTVTDNGGKTASDTVIIAVVGTGVPPDACHCCFATGECQDVDPLECLDLGGTPGPGACTTAEACCLPDDTCQMLDPLCCIAQDGTSFAGEACTLPAACCFPSGECAMLDPVCCVAQGGTAVPFWVCVDPVACCQSDGNCALLEPICCQLQGDTPQDEGSVCTSPEGCCLLEPSGTPSGECADVDPECCDDVGGVSQGAGTTCTAPEACCLPDDTCQDLDPLCCAAQGGTRQGIGTTCTAPEACCLSDDSCRDLDPLCCAELGGAPRGPGSACTVPEACCLLDNTCQMLDPECCENLGGLAQGTGTTCTPLEACCLQDDTCEDLDPLCCVEQGGTPQGPGSVCTATEACCLPDDTCEDLDPACCAGQGGTPQGPGSTCTATEACCLPDGTCETLDPLCCADQGGTLQGPGSTCGGIEACCVADDTCVTADVLCCVNELGGAPQGPGSACTEPEACCLPDDTCTMLDPVCCDDLGGVSQGPGSMCTELVACCFDNGSCQDLDPLCCDELGGTPSEISEVCLGDGNGDGIDDACEPACPSSSPPLPDPVTPDIGFGTKNRYLSFAMADQGEPIAIRVTFDAIPGHPGATGRTMWVQEPFAVTEASCCNNPTPPPTFSAATLGCTTYYDDNWSTYGRVDVYNDAVIPDALFTVQAIRDSCEEAIEEHYSAPLPVQMSGAGDIVGDCGPRPCTAPQGVVDFVDISACVEKFRNLPDAPRKARADVINSNIALALPDRKVDFVDISCVVEAFRGSPCVLPGPPAVDPCGP